MITTMTKKKTNPKHVDPKNKPYSVGALVPEGGDFRPTAYCELHKLRFEAICPVCSNQE